MEKMGVNQLYPMSFNVSMYNKSFHPKKTLVCLNSSFYVFCATTRHCLKLKTDDGAITSFKSLTTKHKCTILFTAVCQCALVECRK